MTKNVLARGFLLEPGDSVIVLKKGDNAIDVYKAYASMGYNPIPVEVVEVREEEE